MPEPGEVIDVLLGLCSHSWYADGDMIDGGCSGNEGASHLCVEDRDHDGSHRCQDCGAVDPPLEQPC